MKNKYCFTAVLLAAVAAAAALFVNLYGNLHTDGENGRILAVTSFYPVYIAAANVAGDCEGIEVRNLSEPQTGCLHDFQLTPEDMKLLSKADIFLVNGGGMESFLAEAAEEYPDLTIAKTAEEERLLSDNAHVWMSLKRYRRQIAVIAEWLCRTAPEYEEALKENAAVYDRKIADLEAQQEEILSAAPGGKIISFHEAYAYLAEDYGLETIYELNLDEERQVSAGEAAEVLKAASENGDAVIFAEELYGSSLAEMVQKETGARVYYLDTLVRGGYGLDSYIDGMQENINIVKEAFGV